MKSLENSVTSGRTRRRSRVQLVLTAFLAGLVLIPSTKHAAQESKMRDTAVAQASQVYGIPEDRLSVINEAWLAGRIFRAKVLDSLTGDIHVVSLRASGDVVSEPEIGLVLREELRNGFIGKIERNLKQRASADPEAVSPVIIWVKAPDVPGDAWRVLIRAGKTRQVFNEARILHFRAQEPVARFLANRGIPIKYASSLAPFIEASVPNSLLTELENLPQVTQVYLRESPQADLSVAIPAIRADQVWSAGVTGVGVKVGIVESGFFPDPQNLNDYYSALPVDNPYLGAVTNFSNDSPRPSSHAAQVMGVIASTHLTYRGVAYNVNRPLNCGNAVDSLAQNGGPGIRAATDWAVGTIGANVINQSWGTFRDQSDPNLQDVITISPDARHDDYLVRTYLATITCSTGNDPSKPVKDPANGYNVIGVGAFDPGCNAKWSNDIIGAYSTYLNPKSPHNDREKPELVAPGNLFSTIETSPWLGSLLPGVSCPSGQPAGTSLAAPGVAGAAALLMQAKPSLKTRPDELKAILMASAIHNIEGNSRLSDADGTGALVAKAAYDVVANGWSSYTPVSVNSPTVQFNVTAGKIVRFVISWFSQGDDNGDFIWDFNLSVKNPSGSVVATSASFDNNYEIVEFTAASTGTYTARISRAGNFQGPYPEIGWAYYLQ